MQDWSQAMGQLLLQVRRMAIVRGLLDRDCDLAFRVLHAWSMSPVDAYCSAVTQAVQAGDPARMQRLLSNMQGTATATEFDKVCTAPQVVQSVLIGLDDAVHSLHCV